MGCTPIAPLVLLSPLQHFERHLRRSLRSESIWREMWDVFPLAVLGLGALLLSWLGIR